MYKKYGKRMLDLAVSLAFTPFLLIPILIVGGAIYFEDKGPIFFKSKRRGLNGKIFNMIKFRSMKVNSKDLRNADRSAYNSKNDSRVTRVGKFIRRTSIDELPQILNVLRGEMSLVGPRAPIPREGYTWDDLNDAQKKRLAVKPGITGYAAGLYRNSISKEEKMRLDHYYVDNISLIFDIKIIFWTVKTVVLRKNLYSNE